MGNTQEIGQLGEDIACRFLEKRGYSIVERNYLKKWGEIDIIAKNKGILHFIEVKSVSRPSDRTLARTDENSGAGDSRETTQYRPEENVHPQKLKRLGRAIQSYLAENNLDDAKWQFDVLTVKIDDRAKEARVQLLENIVL